MSAPIASSIASAAWCDREQRRVRAHLRRAERAARRAPIALDPLRETVRALLLDELAHYRARGVFPRNRAVPGLQPVFVDDLGTRCAVAHLLDASGQSALVDDLAARRNLAYVPELVDEPALVAWLTAAGLSLAQAAAIQPGYRQVPAECVCGLEVGAYAPPYAVPATAVLDVQLSAAHEYGFNSPADGVVVAIDGTTADYVVGQSVRVIATNNYGPLPQGTIVLAPVGGPADPTRFFVPRAIYRDGGAAEPVDAGTLAPLVAGYVVHDGAVSCVDGLGPLPRADFVRAVESSSCKAVLGAIDPRWTAVRYSGSFGDTGCACTAPRGHFGAPSTLGLLLALLAVRRRRRVRRAE